MRTSNGAMQWLRTEPSLANFKQGDYGMAKRKMSTFERLRRGEKLSRRERRNLERCLQAEGPELEIVHPNAAGIDVGNESHFVGIKAGLCEQPVQEFGSWTADLKRMVQWLQSHGVKTVVMQSTGVYFALSSALIGRVQVPPALG